MKKIVLFTILLVLSTAIAYKFLESKDNNSEIVEEEQIPGIDYFIDENKGITAVFIKPEEQINIFYDTETKQSVLDVSESNNFKIAINGGFFSPDNSHAGLFILNGIKEVPAAPLDKQLSHIVDISENKPIFYLATDYKDNSAIIDAFQTGPLLLDENIIQTKFIEDSLNGEGEYFRSILGFTNTDEKFFLITTEKYDLITLANEIIKIPQLQGKVISAVNLDGGSSVSLFVRDAEDLSYSTFKKLPVLLYVK